MRFRTRAVASARRQRALAAIGGVAIAVLLVVGVPEVTHPVTSCALGAKVGSAWIWTPGILLNVPLGGGAAWGDRQLNWTFSSGSLVVGELPTGGGGSALELGSNETGINGVFGLANWSFYEAQNRSTAYGTGNPCTQPYVAEIHNGLNCGAVGNLSSVLVLPDNASDAVQPHYIPSANCSYESATPGATLYFDTSYHSAAAGSPYTSETIRLCGFGYDSPLDVSLTGVAGYPIDVSMTVGGATIRAMGFVRWAGPSPTPEGNVPTAQYSLPNGWAWNISTIEAGTLPTVANPTTTSLLAFERSAC